MLGRQQAMGPPRHAHRRRLAALAAQLSRPENRHPPPHSTAVAQAAAEPAADSLATLELGGPSPTPAHLAHLQEHG